MSLVAYLPVIGPLIEKALSLIPDPNERARERAKIESDLQAAENAVVQGQIEINKIEASHRSIFVAGWRPFIGWVGGSALAWMFVFKPMLTWLMTLLGHPMELPDTIESEMLFQLVLALLGIGGMRSFEKWKGVNHR